MESVLWCSTLFYIYSNVRTEKLIQKNIGSTTFFNRVYFYRLFNSFYKSITENCSFHFLARSLSLFFQAFYSVTLEMMWIADKFGIETNCNNDTFQVYLYMVCGVVLWYWKFHFERWACMHWSISKLIQYGFNNEWKSIEYCVSNVYLFALADNEQSHKNP